MRKAAFETALKQRAADFMGTKYQILVVVIMMHGEERGVLYCSDGKKIAFKEILEAFKDNRDKPKVRKNSHQFFFSKKCQPR